MQKVDKRGQMRKEAEKKNARLAKVLVLMMLALKLIQKHVIV